MPFDEVKQIWMNGKLVDFAEAKIHVFTHALHYGSGLFEGIRCYVTKDNGPSIFRLDDHTRRAVFFRHKTFYAAKIISIPDDHNLAPHVDLQILKLLKVFRPAIIRVHDFRFNVARR